MACVAGLWLPPGPPAYCLNLVSRASCNPVNTHYPPYKLSFLLISARVYLCGLELKPLADRYTGSHARRPLLETNNLGVQATAR